MPITLDCSPDGVIKFLNENQVLYLILIYIGTIIVSKSGIIIGEINHEDQSQIGVSFRNIIRT